MSTTEIRNTYSSSEEKSTFDKASIPVEEEDFAQMNGVSVNDHSRKDQLTTQLQPEVPEVPEPEEIITTRGVFQQPWIKAVVVGSGGLLIFGILGLMANSGFNAISNTNSAPSPQITQEPTETQNEENQPKDDTGETKTALALTSQKGELQDLKQRTANTDAAAKPSPSPVPTSTLQPQPRPQPRQTYNRQPPQPSGFTSRNPPMARTVAPPPPKIQAPKASPASQAAPVDANQQWLAASNVGSFSAGATTETASDEISASGIEGGTGTPNPTAASTVASNKADTQVQDTDPQIDYNSKFVLVGSRASGKLETPIAWSKDNETQANQKYLIQLSQALKASDGREALPKGAYIIAQIVGASQSEYVQLQAVSALVNRDGSTQEKKLPEGAILILSKSGKLLKAETRKGSDLGSSLFSSVVAGVAKAAQIQNNPTSQITTSSYGFSSSTTTNDNKDLAAGFAEGALGEILQGVQSQNQQLQGTDKVFVIEAGKSVQIFVNQSVNI